MKAIKITTNNEISIVEIEQPLWKNLGSEVGGFFERVKPSGLMEIGKQFNMVVNESAHYHLPVNLVASILYGYEYIRREGDINDYIIVGDVIILSEAMVDLEMDFVGLEENEIKRIMRRLKNIAKFIEDGGVEIIEN